MGILAYGSNSPPRGYRLDCLGTAVDFGQRLSYSGVDGGDTGQCGGGEIGPVAYLNYDGHSGYDFDTDFGDVVLAAAGGTLEYPDTNPDPVLGGDPGRFNALRIRHPNGLESW